MFDVRRVVDQKGEVEVVVFGEILDLVERPDLVALVGGVWDAMAEI
jgi:hypothetical protein